MRFVSVNHRAVSLSLSLSPRHVGLFWCEDLNSALIDRSRQTNNKNKKNGESERVFEAELHHRDKFDRGKFVFVFGT